MKKIVKMYQARITKMVRYVDDPKLLEWVAEVLSAYIKGKGIRR